MRWLAATGAGLLLVGAGAGYLAHRLTTTNQAAATTPCIQNDAALVGPSQVPGFVTVYDATSTTDPFFDRPPRSTLLGRSFVSVRRRVLVARAAAPSAAPTSRPPDLSQLVGKAPGMVEVVTQNYQFSSVDGAKALLAAFVVSMHHVPETVNGVPVTHTTIALPWKLGDDSVASYSPTGNGAPGTASYGVGFRIGSSVVALTAAGDGNIGEQRAFDLATQAVHLANQACGQP